MQRILPPLCLLLAAAMLVAGFGLWAVESPEAGVDLHRARVTGDEPYREVLEAKLQRRQQTRHWLLGGLFLGAGFFAVAGLLTMRPTNSRPHKGG